MAPAPERAVHGGAELDHGNRHLAAFRPRAQPVLALLEREQVQVAVHGIDVARVGAGVAVIDPGGVELLEPVEHLLAGGHQALPALVALTPAAAAQVARIRVHRAVEEIEAGDPHDHRRMIAVVAHPHGGAVEGALPVLLPDQPPSRIHHVLVGIEDILRHQVSLAIGFVEIPPRVGGIAPAYPRSPRPSRRSCRPPARAGRCKSTAAAGGSRCR